MDENQINQVLKNVKRYQGSFALDELNQIKIFPYPSFFIVNLDKRENEGTHWIAIAVYMRDVYICDSLGGLIPDNSFPRDLITFLKNLTAKRKIHITKQLQPSHSSYCGHYCIAFVNEMSLHNCFKTFLSFFTCDLQQNDIIVRFLNKNEI